MRCTRSPACVRFFLLARLSSGLGDRCRYRAMKNQNLRFATCFIIAVLPIFLSSRQQPGRAPLPESGPYTYEKIRGWPLSSSSDLISVYKDGSTRTDTSNSTHVKQLNFLVCALLGLVNFFAVFLFIWPELPRVSLRKILTLLSSVAIATAIIQELPLCLTDVHIYFAVSLAIFFIVESVAWAFSLKNAR